MDMDIARLQRALAAKGFDPGPVDGIMGRLTRAAVVAFQKSVGLQGLGVVGPKTRAALFGSGPAAPFVQDLRTPPWYALAETKKGLHERRDNGILARFLRSDGPTLGDPARLPWCGDFVETCIAVTLPGERLPGNPYLARNWMRFGEPLGEPALGAVAVFWRGSRSGTSGHVGFYAGEDAGHVHVLGGNQSDAVTVARLGKDRLLGYRWPSTYPMPRTGTIARGPDGVPISLNEA
ncbi:NlpC/P60 family protein [Salinarimonas sp. NSM]|uniref:NlpC/P60 family protein n=1 Tax=Salinarimonas sp. NSM TaxID=3458003 RepID=UPI0040350589